MKKLFAVLVGFLSAPSFSLANYEACQTDLSNKFNVDKGVAGDLCSLNSVFIQWCMKEESKILSSTDFQALAIYCTDLLIKQKKGENQFDLQKLRVNQF